HAEPRGALAPRRPRAESGAVRRRQPALRLPDDPARHPGEPVRPAPGAALRERRREDLRGVRQAVLTVRAVWEGERDGSRLHARAQVGAAGGRGDSLISPPEGVVRNQPSTTFDPRTGATPCLNDLKAKSPSLPAHPRASALPSRSTWPTRGRRWLSTTPPASRELTASLPRSPARAAGRSPCKPMCPGTPTSSACSPRRKRHSAGSMSWSTTLAFTILTCWA